MLFRSGNTSLTGGSTYLNNNGSIGGPNWSIDSGGNATFNNVRLTQGSYNRQDNIIDFNNFKVSSGGVMSASGVDISGKITATSGSFTGTVNASGGSFKGNIDATGGTFRGTLDAVNLDTSNFTVNGHPGQSLIVNWSTDSAGYQLIFEKGLLISGSVWGINPSEE